MELAHRSVAEVCRSLGVPEQTYYRWRKEYGSKDGSGQAVALEQENTRLRRAVQTCLGHSAGGHKKRLSPARRRQCVCKAGTGLVECSPTPGAIDASLLSPVVTLAGRFGRYGYRRVTALLRRAGWRVNHKRVERIWRREGLRVPQKQPKRGRCGSTTDLRSSAPLQSEPRLGLRLRPSPHHDGRAFRLLTVIDGTLGNVWLSRWPARFDPTMSCSYGPICSFSEVRPSTFARIMARSAPKLYESGWGESE